MIGLLISPMGTTYVWFFELTALLSAVALVLNWKLFSEEPFIIKNEETTLVK
jgi:hypothetical protein